MKKMKMVIIMDKFPFLKHTQDKIKRRKKIIDLNNEIKLELPSVIELTDTKYEKLKLQKILLQLEQEQAKNYKQLSDDESFFKTFREKLKSGMERANLKYDEVLKEARQNIMKDEKFAQKFKQYEQFDFDKNWEAKISFFIELEELLSK